MSTDESLLPASLAALAGARKLILDEHMYRLPPQARLSVTFRLQLFTAPGSRPVAIATQKPHEGEGASLTNAAQTCAAAVWQQHFPGEPEPPVWVAHMILPEYRHLAVVTFTADPGTRTLRSPRWRRVPPAAVDALVGQPVDLERGHGFTPPKP